MANVNDNVIEENAHSREKVFITPSGSSQAFPFIKVYGMGSNPVMELTYSAYPPENSVDK